MEIVISKLHDEEFSVRKEALETLEKSADNRVVKPIIESFQNDKELRYYAARALGKLGDDRAIHHLIKD